MSALIDTVNAAAAANLPMSITRADAVELSAALVSNPFNNADVPPEPSFESDAYSGDIVNPIKQLIAEQTEISSLLSTFSAERDPAGVVRLTARQVKLLSGQV